MDRCLLKDYVTQSYLKLGRETSLAEAKSKLLRSESHEAYVCDTDDGYVGSVTLNQLVRAEEQGLAMDGAVSDLAQPEGLVLMGNTSIWETMQQLADFVGESIPVVEDEHNPRLLGVVFEATIVKAYMETMDEIRRQEHTAP